MNHVTTEELLSSIIGKLYDFIQFKMNNRIQIIKSSIWFQGKPFDESMCTFVLKEVSQYYINKGSCVH